MGCVVSAPPKAIKLSAKTLTSKRTTQTVNTSGVFCCCQEESSRCLGQGSYVLRYLELALLKTCKDPRRGMGLQPKRQRMNKLCWRLVVAECPEFAHRLPI